MKRDLKLNISELRTVYRSIRSAWEALGEITYASGRFREILKNQESLAYEELTRIWDERIEGPEKELSGRLETLSEMVLSYINGMTAYVEPEDEGLLMRVDRNDIRLNCVQIDIVYENLFLRDLHLMQLTESARDYKRTYIPDPFCSAEENAAKKAAAEEAEREEREKRERNYRKLEEFHGRLYGETMEKIKGYVEKINEVYREHIVPFENTDDAYKKKLSSCYDDWATFGERMGDIGNGFWDVGRGALDAVADLVKGIGGLLKGTGEIILWAGASVLEPFGVELSDEIEDDVEQIFATGKMVLSDPVNAIGAVGQNICDVVDEEGVAYSVSYVAADVLIEIALEKGIGKIKEFKNAKHVSKVDEVADAAGDLTGVERRVINKVDEVIEGGSVPKTGVGNTDISIENFTVKDVPTVKNGEFNDFFNSLSVDELDALWSKPEIRDVIEARLRSPGGLHEWHLVSRTPQFKYWDISAEQIKDLRTLTSDVEFVNPSGIHGGRGSTAAHNELLKIIDTSNDYDTFVRRLNNWANYRLKGGVEALPEGLQIK